MGKQNDHGLKQLCDRLGYHFSDPGLLKLALTHSSARAVAKADKDNERLEFLGDRVLGLAIAELLTATFPDAPEGQLARWFNHLVRANTCAEVGQVWELGNVLVMSGGEAGSGGRKKMTILANACEAVLGAVFLDADYQRARDLIHRFWEPYLHELEEAAADAKSALQEWAQGRGLPLPRYVEAGRSGPDHAPLFTTEVCIEGEEPARGEGASKRAAEQAAALAFLLREKIWERAHG
ncbi:ribonuclease III [Methyloligella sp. 2.7D]|uniref:ribonuclease III n=1 Tax=unclassified Methyloligella TaxID=2625955 RepID=UPI00157C1B1E|nr:ribonuclease III [Methyloligella sp. GL2]QKP77611.1 ribonuclease III [Methyloligella sp. GL2]